MFKVGVGVISRHHLYLLFRVNRGQEHINSHISRIMRGNPIDDSSTPEAQRNRS